jgi:glycolate oxidase FAD binding subunit
MTATSTWIEYAQQSIREATTHHRVIRVRGGGSKDFYGNAGAAEVLDTRLWQGIIDYQPRELTLTARAGTALAEIENLLAEQRQMLPFEPPHFGAQATLGGCVASGLSGPRRPYAGPVRDAMLGLRLLDGHAQQLHFGGRVIKNVAGYDVSRLLVGSMGTLGVLTEVSLKLLPCPECERTQMLEMDQAQAILTMNGWAAQPLPISASAWCDGVLFVRLSGTVSALKVAVQQIGGEQLSLDEAFWQAIREQTRPEFSLRPLWRLSVPPATPVLPLSGAPLIEWGGGVRWYGALNAGAMDMREAAWQAGGHATLFRANGPVAQAFTPLPEPLAELQQRIRRVFDPYGVFNSGRI